MKQNALIVAGPTASGKSSLAIKLAKELNGVIINADSMQIYKELSIITARPSPKDGATVPHTLYGAISGFEECDAAKWCGLAASEMKRTWNNGKLPIITGGTGMYIKSLTDGLSPIPDIDETIRTETRALADEIGAAALHEQLHQHDKATADRLKPNDAQRICRAWEVLKSTGKPMSYWRSQPNTPVISANFFTIVLAPDRNILYQRCNNRFEKMLKEDGAIEEIKNLISLNIPKTNTIMKALGVPEVIDYLNGNINIDEAISKASQTTRNYAKRQLTWLRNQVKADITIENGISPLDYKIMIEKITTELDN
ncbi:MAG: tRNA (adenosine(37)-N6)-dimethylallyltransferase MiaA [Alphaproteobacteria bacterium]|nr:tRNA (adenosine(37)-N6)-dimethylallyltransferase MiaA [Alphaproteobacteria bacterium]